MIQKQNFKKSNNRAYYRAKSKHNYNQQKNLHMSNSKGYTRLFTIKTKYAKIIENAKMHDIILQKIHKKRC